MQVTLNRKPGRGHLEVDVWFLKKPGAWMYSLARCIILLLNMLWLPALVGGLIRGFLCVYDGSAPIGFRGLVAGMILGYILHEMAHGVAAMSVGADFYGFGAGFRDYVFRFYTVIDDTNIRRAGKRTIYAAGVQTNLLISGASLLIGPSTEITVFFYGIALINAILATVNLLIPMDGLDGTELLSCCLRMDLVETAMICAQSRSVRRQLAREGIHGRVTVLLLLFVYLVQKTIVMHMYSLVLQAAVALFFVKVILL